MNEYKGKNVSEKSWLVYDTICNFGKELNKLKNMNDESQKKPIANSFSKYFPGSEDMRELLSEEVTSCKEFVKLYCNTLDIELDEEIIWPYQWHLNL